MQTEVLGLLPALAKGFSVYIFLPLVIPTLRAAKMRDIVVGVVVCSREKK